MITSWNIVKKGGLMMNDRNSIEKIRQFNRFYTQVIGLLDNKLLKSDYSLTEARVLFELGQAPSLVARDLVTRLRLDPAYLSRLLKRFEKQGLIHKKISSKDTRKQVLSLTAHGKLALRKLQDMSNEHVTTLLGNITKEEQEQLVQAMTTIERILMEETSQPTMFTLRSYRPGDIGYITYRHGIFYSQNYGFDVTFDAYVASGLAQFVTQFDPQKDHLWVVEANTTIVGSIAIVKADEGVAQLRWFLVEPQARGNGLGKKLLHEAIAFCRRQQYRKIILWTVSNLETARYLYGRCGFQITTTKTHQIWGQELTEELWELELR
jgi:DNA-binding MarR family transcriptional regulator/N-acetylglutamate synthase-like GNAT family acetyltransferase